MTSAEGPRKALQFPVAVLVSLELYVMSEDHPEPLRVVAWLRLVKCRATLRWGDLQRVWASELQLRSTGLHGIMRRTKLSCSRVAMQSLATSLPRSGRCADIAP